MIAAPLSRVLIVDDELHDRQILEIMLAPEGLVLYSVASAEEAIARVASTPPDLILLDVRMPVMDGFTLAARLKHDESTRSIPIIMITARDDYDARLRGLDAGAEEFLSKPVDRAELCARVRNLLRLKAYADYHDKYSRMLEGQVDLRGADLIESERLYRSTFDAAPIGIVHVGLDGRWLQVNQRLCELLGYTAGDPQDPAALQSIQTDPGADEWDAFRRLASGELDRFVIPERRYARRGGGSVWTRVNMSVHRGADGLPQRVICVIEDTTEWRALDAQVRQANKMDAIGRLASGVAHDFNNLLTVILGFTEIVAADVSLAQRHGSDLREVVNAAERAAALTGQLLAFSRQQVLHTTAVDVNGLIRRMTGMLGRLIGENIEITLSLAPTVSHALADPGQLEQVVMNLVLNARDAMPDGGRVTIQTSDARLENSEFHEEAIVEGQYVLLAVTDTGSGMPPETRRRVFEPFFTTKETGKGTGLGLSTTYGIVKQSKGHIWVYSEPGEGTTFKVYLPGTTEEARAAGDPVVVPLPRLVSETVLLVEDEAAVRHLSKRILVKAGYRVLEAADGQEAELMFDLHANTIALVVTDVVMPGCGGPELMARLHVRAPLLRVLYMSGYTEQSAARTAGFDRGLPYVQKPFTASEFVLHVRDALDR